MISWSLTIAALLVVVAAEYEDSGMHCKGGGVTDLMQWDHSQCAAYCDIRKDCFGYVFNLKDNFTCILKGENCAITVSDVWRFFRKTSTGGSAVPVEGIPSNFPYQVAGTNSDWNSDPADIPPTLDFNSMGELDTDGAVVTGPPGNMGNSFTKRDFHCAGQNIGNGQPWSLGQCAAACLQNNNCIGFIRLITGDQQCILKEAGCTKKAPTVWVFYEKTDNGEVLPDMGFNTSEETDRNLPPVVADTPSFGMNDPSSGEHFTDIHQHCKGGVISNEMRGHDQCSRACLDAPDCVGYSIGIREPFQCYLKSKECEIVGTHPIWTFARKNDQLSPSAPSPSGYPSIPTDTVPDIDSPLALSQSSEEMFREMRAVRCIKFAEEYGASSAEQCKQMCLERETFCVGVSFRSGSCKLITSFDCGGWQIFKKMEDLMNAGHFQMAPHQPQPPQPSWNIPNIPEAITPSMVDMTGPYGIDSQLSGSLGLNDAFYEQEDSLHYFHKLGGNCRGGRVVDEMYGSEAQCAAKCHQDARCLGFSYLIEEQRCALKADACHTPNAVNPKVAFWLHLQRQ